ncbi:MAG: c-type cytochrome [Anaerolineales bacterium]
MRRVLKWIGRILAGLLVLAGLLAAVVSILSERMLDTEYVIPEASLAIDMTNADLERGQHLVNTLGFCTECHGPDLAGLVMEDDPVVGRLVSTNLTGGEGGIGGRFTEQDWVRAIRHGVGEDGRSLIVMPANFFGWLGDSDLASVIAYLETLPPVDNVLPEIQIRLMARLFVIVDSTQLPASVIDHQARRPAEPQPGATAEYGRYLANNCKLCHGPGFAGIEGSGGGLNLTPGGDLANWTEADFITALRTGVRPSGEDLDPELMPWETLGKLTDDEIKALWLFLQSLPPVEGPPEG